MAAVDAVPATHGAGGGATVAVQAASPPSTLVHAASAVCCVAAYKFVSVSSLLAYHATFAVSLLCLARAAWPDRVDAVLRPLGAYARRAALLARADLEADLRRLRDAARGNALTAPACAWAEERARRARAAAVAGWAEADGAAWLVLLRLLGRALRLAAGVLLDAAREEAKAQAPSVQEYLRGVARVIRPSPASCKEGGEDDGGLVLEDIVSLVGVGFYLLFGTKLILKSLNAVSATQFDAACLAAACGLAAALVADWIDQPDDDSDDTDTTGDRHEAARREGGGAGDGEAAKLEEVQASWQFMRVLVIIAFCVDGVLLHVTLGPRPLALALLALGNLMVLDIGRQVQLAPDCGGGEAGVGAAVGKWKRGAMAVYAASSIKILAIYVVLDFYLAALSFLWLCFMAGFLLAEQDSFFERDEEGAVSGEDHVTGGAEERADESRTTEHSNTSSSEDEEEGAAQEEHRDASDEEHSGTRPSEDEEEGCTLEEHRGSSEEHSEEEPDCGSGGSTDDGWDLVEVDPEMPVKDSCGANRKSSKIFSWK